MKAGVIVRVARVMMGREDTQVVESKKEEREKRKSTELLFSIRQIPYQSLKPRSPGIQRLLESTRHGNYAPPTPGLGQPSGWNQFMFWELCKAKERRHSGRLLKNVVLRPQSCPCHLGDRNGQGPLLQGPCSHFYLSEIKQGERKGCIQH